jgi:hypothetical protein
LTLALGEASAMLARPVMRLAWKRAMTGTGVLLHVFQQCAEQAVMFRFVPPGGL